MKVLQVLEDITPNRTAVDAVFFPVEPGHGERADLELLHNRGVQFQIVVINQHQIAAKGLDMPVADHKAVVVLAHGQAVITVKDDGQIGFFIPFNQTKLSAFVF